MVLSHVVSEIFNVEKYRDLEMPVKSQSRSLKVVPFDRLFIVYFLLVFYSNFVPKMHHFEIFDFKNAVTLKKRVKVIENVIIRSSVHDFLLTFYSKYSYISCHF